MAGLERALPASYYLSDDGFDRERERLLYREWFCAGRADQVERPGSLQVVEVAGESVLLVRTRAGELRAHYNVCRHRGSQVVPCPPAPPGGSQAGPARKAGSLRCPYHSWTYRLEGDLLRAPWSEGIDGFDQAAFALHPVGVATWAGTWSTARTGRCARASSGAWPPAPPPAAGSPPWRNPASTSAATSSTAWARTSDRPRLARPASPGAAPLAGWANMGCRGRGAGGAGERRRLGAGQGRGRVLGLEQFELGHHLGASHDHARIIRRSYHTPGYVRLAGLAYQAWEELEREAGERLW